MPLGLGALSGDAGCDRYEGWLIWIGRRQGDAHAGFEFLDAHGDLEERPAQRFEGGLAPERAPRRGVAKLMQQPIGAGVEKEAELVGLPAVTGRTVGLGVKLVIERAVLDGRLHAAIGPFEQRITVLEYIRLCTEEHAVYCGRGHPLYDRPDADITMADIAESSFVARGYMDRADLERLDIRKHGATVFNMEAQAILILSGGYIGFLPVQFAERWMATAELRQIRRHELGYRSQFHLIARRGAPKTLVIRTFLADLRAELALEGEDAPASAALASGAMAQNLSSRPKPSTGAS